MGAFGFILRLAAVALAAWVLAALRSIYLALTHEKRPLDDPEGRSNLL